MPFAITALGEGQHHQVFSVDISDVDRERERLSLVLIDASGEEQAMVCTLVHNGAKYGLQIDFDRSHPAVMAMIDDMSQGEGVVSGENLESSAYLMVASPLSDTDLMLAIPPLLAIGRDGTWRICPSDIEEGDSLRLESIVVE